MTDPYNNKITRQLDIDRYYYYLNMITENVRNGYNNMVIKYCELSLPLIPLLIEKTKKDFGEFDISSIPAIELGAKLWSYQHNLEKIKEILNDAKLETRWDIRKKKMLEDKVDLNEWMSAYFKKISSVKELEKNNAGS